MTAEIAKDVELALIVSGMDHIVLNEERALAIASLIVINGPDGTVLSLDDGENDGSIMLTTKQVASLVQFLTKEK